MVSEDEIRKHRADTALWVRVLIAAFIGTVLGFVSSPVPKMGWAGTLTVGVVAFLLALFFVLPNDWSVFRQHNIIGYDLVWYIAENGQLDNRLEQRDRRNALKGWSHYALYQKLGGWGGPKYRLGVRTNDEPYPVWVDDFRIHSTGQGHEVRVTDKLGCTVLLTISELLILSNRWKAHGVSQWLFSLRGQADALRTRLEDAEQKQMLTEQKLAEREGELSQLRGTCVHLKDLADRAILAIEEAARSIDVTSRFQHSKEGQALRVKLGGQLKSFGEEYERLAVGLAPMCEGRNEPPGQ